MKHTNTTQNFLYDHFAETFEIYQIPPISCHLLLFEENNINLVFFMRISLKINILTTFQLQKEVTSIIKNVHCELYHRIIFGIESIGTKRNSVGSKTCIFTISKCVTFCGFFVFSLYCSNLDDNAFSTIATHQFYSSMHHISPAN